MYIDKEAITVYSLNVNMSSMSNNQSNIEEDYWGVGLSSVLKGKNEYSIYYEKKEDSNIQGLHQFPKTTSECCKRIRGH